MPQKCWPLSASLQWILLELDALDTITGSWVLTPSLRKSELFDPPSMQQSRETKVSLDAARLGVNSVLLIALAGELLLGGPRPCPHGRIFDGNLVCERVRPRQRPALDQVQVFTRALEVGLRAEIRHIDDEGAALPVSARVAIPLADARRQVPAPVHDDIALPTLALTDVIEDRDAVRGLHDAAEAANAAAELRQPGGQAAVGRRAILRTIMAIHASEIVAR